MMLILITDLYRMGHTFAIKVSIMHTWYGLHTIREIGDCLHSNVLLPMFENVIHVNNTKTVI